jgi:hypothetical protein
MLGGSPRMNTMFQRRTSMVAKNKTGEKRGKVEVDKLKLKKETVKDLTGSQQKQVKGGANDQNGMYTACTRRATGCIT